MGLISGQIRLIFLTLYKSDLEYRIQTISQTKLQMASGVNQLVSIGSDLDPDSPEMKVLNARSEKLKLIDQQLDGELKRYQTQLESINVEIESAQKFVQGDIKQTFNYAGGSGG